MKPKLTRHASIRAQQRGFPVLAIGKIQEYGTVEYDYRKGTNLICLRDQAKEELCKELRRERDERDQALKVLESCSHPYLIEADEGTVITCGHHFRKRKHQHRRGRRR